jgi:primosomal protein N'
MVMPSASALAGPRQMIEYRPTGAVPARLTPQREQALARIEGRQGTIRELSAHAEVSDAVMRGLVATGAIERIEVDGDLPFPDPDPGFASPRLNLEQAAAADSLTAAIGKGFDPVLLDGVTGSGKTEVYFEAIAEALRQDRQVLVLLPEIALTEPFLTRFTARFGCEPVAWHSDLRSSQRRRAWRAIASGDARVVVGARSALFLPYAKLGLIVVDEAHESSFKQEEGVQYHARDVAVMRAHFEEIPIILSTATPAIETRHMVDLGRYRELKLTERHGRAEMPEVRAIDLTQDPPPRGRWLAPSLVACGPGVERIADEVTALFPDARTAIVTSDTIWSPARAAEFVRSMDDGEIDIVVGTQLITKGYHFPNLTLVGVVDADLGLQGGDLRAAERSFQQIQQVAGRAGRGDKPGRVLVQTHDPDAPVIAALVSGDGPGFYTAETDARRDAAMPPFGRLAAIVISSESRAEAEAVARRIGQSAPSVEGMAVFGPAPAPLAMLRGRHRQRILVHAARKLDVQDVIRDWLGALEWSSKVRVTVDVDPYSFL